MRDAMLSLAVFILLTVSAYAGTFAISSYYFAGIPITDEKMNAARYGGGDWVEYDMTVGYKYKPGLFNFGFGAAYMFTPRYGIAGAMEYHKGYKNDKTTIVIDGSSYSIDADIYENQYFTVSSGVKFNIPIDSKFSTFLNSGLALLFYLRTNLAGYSVDNYFAGRHIGIYAGGGLNKQISNYISIHLPVKYQLFFSGEDWHYNSSGTGVEGGYKMTPFSILSVGVGLEFYP